MESRCQLLRKILTHNKIEKGDGHLLRLATLFLQIKKKEGKGFGNDNTGGIVIIMLHDICKRGNILGVTNENGAHESP